MSESFAAATVSHAGRRSQERANLPINLLSERQIWVGTMPVALPGIAEGDLEASNQTFIGIFERLRGEVERRGLDLRGVGRAYLAELAEAGAKAANLCFPEQARDALDAFEQRERRRGVSLTFYDFNWPLPPLLWEVLYTGDPLAGVDPLQLWGFRFPIGRGYAGVQPKDRIYMRDGVLLGVHDDLAHAGEEVERLALAIDDCCRRLGLALEVQRLDQVLGEEIVGANELLLHLTSAAGRYSLIHLACHCESPRGASADHAYLSLTARGQPLELRLQLVLAVIARRRLQGEPFIFINACKSATPGHMLQKINFPVGMLRFGAGGVIATACAVPDAFASAFAGEFYRRLLASPSASVGEVLLATRRHFLEAYENPLGLAYGLYAVSEQQLRLIDQEEPW